MAAKANAPHVPRSLSGLVKQLRKQPRPRQRIVDILAYAAVKHTYPSRLEQFTASERNAARRDKADAYNTALAKSKAVADAQSDPDISDKKKQDREDQAHSCMENLLRAKIALTLDMLDIPATGNPENDIFAIGMQCIGNVDSRIVAPLKADPGTDDETAQSIAMARFFNLVLYDIKTEEILKGRYPDLQIPDKRGTDPVLAVATIYQSLFEIRMQGKKPTYRLKPDVFKNEQDAARFEESLEAVEAELNLMNKRPETIEHMVDKGRAFIDDKTSGNKNGLIGGLFKRSPTQKKPSEPADPKPKKPWL